MKKENFRLSNSMFSNGKVCRRSGERSEDAGFDSCVASFVPFFRRSDRRDISAFPHTHRTIRIQPFHVISIRFSNSTTAPRCTARFFRVLHSH